MQNVSTPVTQVDTAAQFALGSWCEDANGNAYQYCQGIGSTVVGSAVTIGANNVTALTGVASSGPVGFAMAAIGANQFGWYLRRGEGPCVNATPVVAGARLQLTGTAGQVDDTATANLTIVSAFAGTVTTAGAGRVRCTYPSAYGVAL